eukprot:1463883-Lingulodinium_polyedra.AAC.1
MPFRRPHPGPSRNSPCVSARRQFQCPLPGVGSACRRGACGVRKHAGAPRFPASHVALRAC